MMKSPYFQVSEDAMWQNAKKIYGKTENSVNDDVEAVVKWLGAQPHLPEIMDRRSVRYLILHGNSVEKVKRKIDFSYTIRSRFPAIFRKNDEVYKKFMDFVYYVPLPNLTNDSSAIWVWKTRRPELASTIDPLVAVGYGGFLQEIAFQEDTSLSAILILDARDESLEYYFKFTPTILAKIKLLISKGMVMRLKAVYIVNGSNFAKIIMRVIKAIAKAKIVERIKFVDLEELQELIPREFLPKDYGGEQKSLKELQGMIRLKLKEYEARFEDLDGMKVDEKLRPEKLENDDMMGIYGNFKQLDID